MPQIVCNRIGGMLLDSRRWPKPGRGFAIDELPTILARNITFYRGHPEGRRGQQRVYAPLTTVPTTLTTNCNGPIALIKRHFTPTGMEYVIVAGYVYSGADRPHLVVSVFADRQLLTHETFYSYPTTGPADTRDLTLVAESFGNSVLISGPGLAGVRRVTGAKAGPEVGFIRVRFQRTGITIAEAELFDRDLVGFGPGDDDSPYVGRVPPSIGMATFNSRLVVALGGGILASNTADCFAFSTTKWIALPGDGNVTALFAATKYLLVFKERSCYVLTGGLTSTSDTSIGVVDSKRGCLSQQSLVNINGACLALAHDGVWMVQPGSDSVEMSRDIWPLLSGDVRDEWSYDLSAFTPTRESFRHAPAAWLPQRKEFYLALSNGKRLSYTDSDSEYVTRSPHESARNLWFVMSLSGGRPQWSVWDSADRKVAESMCGYTDADGFDTLLTGSHRGSVFLQHCTDRDEVDTTSATTGTGAIDTLDYTVEIVPVPISLPSPVAMDVQAVALSFTETRRDAAGAWVFRYGAGQQSGSNDGSYRETPMIGTGVMPGWGSTYPITMRTPSTVRRNMGIRAVSATDSFFCALRSTNAAPAITSGPRVTVMQDQIEEP